VASGWWLVEERRFSPSHPPPATSHQPPATIF
jgi:hypothetical protein